MLTTIQPKIACILKHHLSLKINAIELAQFLQHYVCDRVESYYFAADTKLQQLVWGHWGERRKGKSLKKLHFLITS